MALDEGHIHAQHGTLFCSKIRALKYIFSQRFLEISQKWNVLDSSHSRQQCPMNIYQYYPTSWQSNLLLAILSFATAPLVIFCNMRLRIEMRTHITSRKGQYVTKGLSEVAKFLRDNPSSSMVRFCNSRKQSQHYCNNFKWKLNEMKLNVDVIYINGSLHKVD